MHEPRPTPESASAAQAASLTAERVALREVQRIFAQVRELPPVARDAAIDIATDNPWVRAEVRSLLTFDADETPTIPGERSSQAFDPEVLIGVQVDEFTIRSLIGIGGMGAVYAAEQRAPARRVALKVLTTAHTSPTALLRFDRESQILARLDHPSIARVIRSGVLTIPSSDSASDSAADGDGYETRPYFVMDLFERGCSITQWERNASPSRRQFVETFAVACDAVGEGHRRGVVHLDLKPSNLLIGEDERLHVIDFGIAKILDAFHEGTEVAEGTEGTEGAHGATGSALDDHVVGTPQYMSPEQFTREGVRVDSRSDVYSLGLILYELLTRQSPASSRIVGLLAPQRFDSTLPNELNAIVLKALALAPDERYGTASELADDLRRWLNDASVLAMRLSTADLLRRLARKNRIATAALAVGALAIVVAMATSIVFAVQASQDAQRARAQTARANIHGASTSLALGAQADAFVSLTAAPLEHSGWETRHMRKRMQNFEVLAPTAPELLVISECIATREVISGLGDAAVHIHDLTGERAEEMIDLRSFASGHGDIGSLSVSTDGSVILAANWFGALMRIDRNAGTVTQIGTGVRYCGIIGALACVVRIDGIVELRDLSTNSVIESLPSFGEPKDVSFTSDRSLGLIAYADGRIRCLQFNHAAGTMHERWVTPPRTHGTRVVALSPSGARIIVAWTDGRIARLDPADGQTLFETDIEGGAIFDLAISPDERKVAASSWTRAVRLIDPDSLAVTRELGGTSYHVWGLEFDHTSSRLYSQVQVEEVETDGTKRANIHLGAWHLEAVNERTGAIANAISDAIADAIADAITDIDTDHSPICATWDLQSESFTSVDDAGVIREMRPLDGSTRTIARVRSRASRIARSGDLIAVGTLDGTAELLEQDASGSWTTRWQRPTGAESVTAIAFSPDNSCIAIGDISNHAACLDILDGRVRWNTTLPLAADRTTRLPVSKAIFTDDGASVTFAINRYGPPRPSFRTSDGALRSTAVVHTTTQADDALLQPNGSISFLGITGDFWREGADGVEPLPSVARNGGVMTANEDFTRIFIGARDGTVRVIEAESAEELMRLDSPSGSPLVVDFDEVRDELRVFTSRGMMRVWHGIPNFSLPLAIHPHLTELIDKQPESLSPTVLPPPLRRPVSPASGK